MRSKVPEIRQKTLFMSPFFTIQSRGIQQCGHILYSQDWETLCGSIALLIQTNSSVLHLLTKIQISYSNSTSWQKIWFFISFWRILRNKKEKFGCLTLRNLEASLISENRSSNWKSVSNILLNRSITCLWWTFSSDLNQE